MMASKVFQESLRGVSRNALDLPVAALAAFAVAFLVFAMPSNLLSEIVGLTGLPSYVAAAEPPLGMTARIAIGLAGALAAFALVFALLRLLDRTGSGEARAEPEEIEGKDLALRLRRRDIHPDAPARLPISAARDLGEPASVPEATSTPLWLAEADLPETVEAEAEPKAAPIPAPTPAPEPARALPVSLPELMERLEQGLARRRVPPAIAPEPPAAPQVFPEPADDRLQSAIDSLQQLAARQS